MSQIATGIGWAVLALGGFCLLGLFAAFVMDFMWRKYLDAMSFVEMSKAVAEYKQRMAEKVRTE